MCPSKKKNFKKHHQQQHIQKERGNFIVSENVLSEVFSLNCFSYSRTQTPTPLSLLLKEEASPSQLREQKNYFLCAHMNFNNSV